MKIGKRLPGYFLLYSYLAFTTITSVVFYFLMLLLGLEHTGEMYTLFLYFAIWFIISSSIFLFIVIYTFNYKLTDEKKISLKNLHRYEALSNATNDAIWDYNILSGKVYYNDTLIHTFGYSREELANNTNWWENNIHPDDKYRVISRMNATLESDKLTWEDEYRFRCKNTMYKIIYDRSFIVRNKQGQPERLIGAMKDITKLRALEKKDIENKLKAKTLKGKSIILSNEKERKKIRYELHEDVNQILAAIKLNISELRNEKPSPTLLASIQYLDDAIYKVKKISNSLSSSTFEFFGLPEALHEVAVIHKKAPRVLVETDLFDEEFIEYDKSLLLYRIIEHEINRISSQIKTDDIKIILKSTDDVAILSILFSTSDRRISEVLDDEALHQLKNKVEMFEGSLQINQLNGLDYSIDVRL